MKGMSGDGVRVFPAAAVRVAGQYRDRKEWVPPCWKGSTSLSDIQILGGRGAVGAEWRLDRRASRDMQSIIVKLQALVRGHLVRRQASNTLRCMQALVAAQHRARAALLRLLGDLDDDKEKPLHTPRMTPPVARHTTHASASNNWYDTKLCVFGT
uniref:Uncharacterized protein n=1 Tax=Oryza brachyantha TaxID=4533 RepID=J3KZW9_ORYBR